MEQDDKSVTDRIKSVRMHKHYSQDYLAKKLGVSQKAYSKIENNETRLNIDTLMSISKILETPVQELLAEPKAPVLNDFSSGRDGDNVIYKTESDKENEKLFQALMSSKDSLIASLHKQIELLQKHIEILELAGENKRTQEKHK
jgi:transcriptional regulator with XRE-family HTH domain